jgi:hypothetical protein
VDKKEMDMHIDEEGRHTPGSYIKDLWTMRYEGIYLLFRQGKQLITSYTDDIKLDSIGLFPMGFLWAYENVYEHLCGHGLMRCSGIDLVSRRSRLLEELVSDKRKSALVRKRVMTMITDMEPILFSCFDAWSRKAPASARSRKDRKAQLLKRYRTKHPIMTIA